MENNWIDRKSGPCMNHRSTERSEVEYRVLCSERVWMYGPRGPYQTEQGKPGLIVEAERVCGLVAFITGRIARAIPFSKKETYT